MSNGYRALWGDEKLRAHGRTEPEFTYIREIEDVDPVPVHEFTAESRDACLQTLQGLRSPEDKG